MSDLPDLAEVDFDLSGGTPDWRDRIASACDAAGVSPRVLVAGVAVFVTALAALWFAVLAPGAGGAPVDAGLPFTRPPEAVSSTVAAPPTEIVVHVAGAVERPGVVRLASDARAIDALEAAGGPAAEADLARLNLAAALVDGQQLYVAAVGEEPPALPVAGPGTDEEPALVDINAASASELEALPGIGPAISAAIVGHRDEHGPFVAVESLLDVPGIGEAKLAGLRDFATV